MSVPRKKRNQAEGSQDLFTGRRRARPEWNGTAAAQAVFVDSCSCGKGMESSGPSMSFDGMLVSDWMILAVSVNSGGQLPPASFRVGRCPSFEAACPATPLTVPRPPLPVLNYRPRIFSWARPMRSCFHPRSSADVTGILPFEIRSSLFNFNLASCRAGPHFHLASL